MLSGTCYPLSGTWYAVEYVYLLSQDSPRYLVYRQASRTRDGFKHEQRRMELLCRDLQRTSSISKSVVLWLRSVTDRRRACHMIRYQKARMNDTISTKINTVVAAALLQ